jgi:hypothetical protein
MCGHDAIGLASALVSGTSTYVLDSEDPLRHGFLVL